jgi:spermidine/putrescine transport system permease protein
VLIAGILVLIYLFIPMFIVAAMSFNVPPSPNVYQFGSFTLSNWTELCKPDGLCASLRRSIEIGALATLGSTILGTMMAFALVRHRFSGRAAVNLFLFLPLASPEIVMGSSLLALFVAAGFGGRLGFWTILIAHIMFCLSFVVVTVKARLSGMDSRLEDAAMDLYANEWQTFWRITFPLVFPEIPMQINVVGTLMFVAALAIALTARRLTGDAADDES